MIFLILIPLAILFLFVLTQPLPTLLWIKLKHGSKAKLLYFPIWGHFYYIHKSQTQDDDPYQFYYDIFKQYPQVELVLTNLQFKPLMIFLKPHLYKEFLINYQNFQKFKLVPDCRLIKQGMITGNGQQWKRQKLLLGSHFKFEQLIKRIPLMNKVMKEKINNLKLQDDVFPSLNLSSAVSGDIVLRSFFGEEIAKLDFNGQDQSVMVNVILSNVGQLQKGPFFYLKWALFGDEWAWKLFPTKKEKEIYDYNTQAIEHMTGIITKRLNQLKNKEREFSNDFIDIYLKAYLEQTEETRPPITMDEMVQQSITLYFAGTETTANLVTTTLYFISKFQDIQQDIYEEIVSVLKNEDEVNPEHLAQLKKTTGVLMECLRFKPVVNCLISRSAVRDTFISEYFIKKGWFVNYISIANSMNPVYFDKPEEINYNRWTADGKLVDSSIDPFAFIPFSAGARNCIGQHMALMEAKMMMCYILRKYKLHLNEEFKKSKWDARITYGLQLMEFVKYSLRK